METFDFLIVLAVILLSTKVLGLLSEKVHMPQVVGALVAGVILGPSVLNVVGETDFLVKTAELGVIFLMFLAGLDTDLDELKKNGVASLIVAIIGVIVPLIGGTVTYILFFGTDLSNAPDLLVALFVGVILTATSVSITVETLREMGKLKGRMGTTILGAAIIDDIVGIIVLTLITSLKDTSVKPATIFIKILVYFVFIAAVALFVHFTSRFIEANDNKRRTSISSVAFCLIMAYVSEKFFGIADITGAYFAGIILCNLGVKNYISKKVVIISYLFFSPVFFASIGIKTSLNGITSSIILFAFILLVIAILTKIIGCGVGAIMCKFPFKESLCIGVGMVSRGEVALIVAQKGEQVGLLNAELFPAIVLVVIVTTLITPILLKILISKGYADENNESNETVISRAQH